MSPGERRTGAASKRRGPTSSTSGRTEQRNEVQERIQSVRNGQSRELNLWNFNLKEIPQEVFELAELESLILNSNSIRVIPEAIRRLSRLKLVQVGGNPIEKIPDIPGLSLDWDTYLRCLPSISR